MIDPSETRRTARKQMNDPTTFHPSQKNGYIQQERKRRGMKKKKILKKNASEKKEKEKLSSLHKQV